MPTFKNTSNWIQFIIQFNVNFAVLQIVFFNFVALIINISHIVKAPKLFKKNFINILFSKREEHKFGFNI